MEPVIVTAFWDVGRGDNCEYPRSNERYYREFEAWARIKNEMIIYTDKNSESKIAEIRTKYNLKDRTTIVVIESIFDIERDIYVKLKKVENNETFKRFRYLENAMGNRADFNYAWLMKYWCLAEAAKIVEKKALLAWMDFGFNHLDNCYTNMEEFDFLWECTPLDMSKIHIFSLIPVDNISGIASLQYLFNSFMGTFHLVPSDMAGTFWKLMKQAMHALLMLDCMDNDQQLLLMAYKHQSDLFEVHLSEWYLPLKEFGAEHLTVREKTIKKEPVKSLIYRYLKKVTKLSYNDRFSRRVKQEADKYHPLS